MASGHKAGRNKDMTTWTKKEGTYKHAAVVTTTCSVPCYPDRRAIRLNMSHYASTHEHNK